MKKETKPTVENMQLSTEELSLALGLCGKPELGRQMMTTIFGELDPKVLEERLTAASHSMIARHLCFIAKSDTIVLAEDFQRLVLPILKFKYMLQHIETGPEGIPVLTNIQCGRDGFFTAGRTEWGVVQSLWHGTLEALPSWLEEQILYYTDRLDEESTTITLSLADLARLQQADAVAVTKELQEHGWDAERAGKAAEILTKPQCRGSLLLVPADDEALKTFKEEEAGPGMLYAVGNNGYGLLFTCDTFKDEVQGELQFLTQEKMRIAIIHILPISNN